MNPIAPQQSININLRQNSSISGVPFQFQSSPPLRCISPANASNRPISPNNNRFPQQQSESISISNRQIQQHNDNINSLSPPSFILHQNQQQYSSETKSIIGGRVFGVNIKLIYSNIQNYFSPRPILHRWRRPFAVFPSKMWPIPIQFVIGALPCPGPFPPLPLPPNQ